MISLDSVSLQRGTKILLHDATVRINPGQKAALVGNNGSGKSSLFQLLLGQLGVDSGNLNIPGHWRIAHMAQEVVTSDRAAVDYVLDGDQALREVERGIEAATAAGNDDKLALLYQQLDDLDGYGARARAEQLLLGLGFKVDDISKPANSFSGGWRIRLNLAQALMSPSDLLLLDEPTNHLDLDAELWLEQWLTSYAGTLLLISHDRDFIDSVCDHTVHIERHQLNSYRGNYSAFERQRAERLAQQQASYDKQQQRVAEIQRFVSRFRAKATKAKQAQSRLKELERMELIAPAHVDSPFNFSFPAPERFSDPLLNLSHADLGYTGKAILTDSQLSVHPGSRIGLLGANGAGKSTLIKSLAGELSLLNGERICGENLRLGYFSQHQLEALDLHASPALHLQRLTPTATEQQIRTFLGGFNFHGDMALDPIEHFSGGEKARLALAIIVWQKPNLLLLDEPTNHLDLEMCHALTVALQGFEGAVIVVSHDRHLLRNTVDQFLLVSHGKAEPYQGDLEDYSAWLLAQGRQASTSTAPEPLPLVAISKKEQRQQAAQLREKLRPLTRQIQQLEKQMAQCDEALVGLEQQLADPALYEADNKAQLQRLLAEQGRLKRESETLEEQWLTVQQEMEDLEVSLSE